MSIIPQLSIVVPCYNEEKLLEKSIAAVLLLENDVKNLEIVIVNDCSKDRSGEIAQELAKRHPQIRYFAHERNQGKGAALRTGFAEAKGDIICVHDADLEYDPQDLLPMYKIINAGRAEVVFGTRFLNSKEHRVLYFWHSVANKVITLACNIFSDLNLTDIECCHKMFRREVIKQITIEENRFGVEPELVSKAARLAKRDNLRIYESAVSYHGRTYAEGKKIGWKDAFRAFWVILKYNTWHRKLG